MLKAAGQRVRKFFEQPVNKAIDAVAGLFVNSDQLSDDDCLIMALIKAVLPSDKDGMERALGRFRSRLELQAFSARKIEYLLDFLRRVAPGDPRQALPILQKYDSAQRKDVLNNLLALALEHGEYRQDALDLISCLSRDLGMMDDEFQSMASAVKEACNNRSRIIRSGTGIILALVVIGLFVLIATWLSSLLFGLALAYIFLPLEQYFERYLQQPPGLFSRLWRKISPFAISKKLKKQKNFEFSAEEISRRKQQAITTKATTLTVSCVVAGSLTLLVAILILLSSYVSHIKRDWNNNKLKASAQSQLQIDGNGKLQSVPVAVSRSESVQAEHLQKTSVKSAEPPAGFFARMTAKIRSMWGGKKSDTIGKSPAKTDLTTSDKVISQLNRRLIGVLDRLKLRFQELPLIQRILNELSDYLAEGKAEKQISDLLLKKSGGLFAFLAKFVAMFAAFLLNILLTFFFFSLLLGKLAGFTNLHKDDSQGASSYLIRTVFNGKWLPQMPEENLREGDRIVGEVINKLRIWLRGYMTMIAIDFCVYTTVFTLLGVPYAPILGAIAGVGILLPYIGPVSSALLTVLVTLAVGGAEVSALQIAGVIGIYLIHNGVIEQFFIYPWIIGESLGLSTLETIIVVLLGGILAGVPGMIFALPTASVIKYLVPQIYRCWR